MANVRVRWIDSISAAATGNKVYREDVEIADIANGVQEYIDTAAPDGATGLKYEVQAHDGAGDETTQEVEGENMDYIDTAAGTEEHYLFDGTANSKFISTYDITGENQMSQMVRAKITGVGGLYGFTGCNNSTVFYFRYNDSNQLEIQLYDGVNILNTKFGWANDSEYHQFGWSYNGTDLKLYLDGTEVASTADATFTQISSKLLYIGARNLTDLFVGEITDVQHYTTGLAEADFQQLFADKTNTPAGLAVNFADQKATDWTDDVSGVVATNQGDVVLVP